MTIAKNKSLLGLHPYFTLRLASAAVVSDYDSHVRNALSVNRLWLVYESDGRCRIRDLSSGSAFQLRQGCMYFMPCGREFAFDLTPGTEWVSLHFNLDLFYGLDIFACHGRSEELEDPVSVGKAREFMGRNDDIESLCLANELIFHLSGSLLSGQTAELQRRFARWRSYEKALAHVKESCNALLTVQELAATLGMRSDVFSRKFSGDMGIAPKNFIATALMRRASKMLLEPGATVRQVAEELEFSSESYLSRFFKKRSGMSPSQFQLFNGGKL